MTESMAKGVSAVITTRNEEQKIEQCLKSVIAQSHSPCEIIVVDNHSTDNTVRISRKYTDLVYTAGPERSAQRNFGIRRASGAYVLFLDADMTLSASVISQCIDKCSKSPDTAGVYIPEIITGDGFWISVRNFERSFYNASLVDCVRFFPRASFDAAGGFDESMSGPEDWDFDRKIRATGKTCIIDAPLYHDEGAFRLGRYLKKKAYYSASMDTYAAKWGRNDPEIRKQLGFYYRFIGVFTESGKWHRLAAHPVLASGMFFLRIMVGAAYMTSRRRTGRQP